MQQDALAQIEVAPAEETASTAVPAEGTMSLRFAGILLIGGAIFTTIFNVLFPRAEDPTDTAAVLTMMAENEVTRQVSFLGVTAGLWLVTAGVVAIAWAISNGPSGALARFGLYGLLVGGGIFTASTGIGMATTEAAVNWVTAGSEISGAEYAIASTLNLADDGVWALSLIVYWSALGLIGIAIAQSRSFPRWLGWPVVVLGFGVAALAGIPIAYGGLSLALIIIFAVLAQLTLVWALATGIWILRRSK